MNTSRRGLFGWLAGGLALAASPRQFIPSLVPKIAPASAPVTYAELADITRKAFMPTLRVQIYQAHPLFLLLRENAERDT